MIFARQRPNPITLFIALALRADSPAGRGLHRLRSAGGGGSMTIFGNTLLTALADAPVAKELSDQAPALRTNNTPAVIDLTNASSGRSCMHNDSPAN